MRSEINTYGEFTYPDRWCMVYDRHYISVNLSAPLDGLTVRVSDTRSPSHNRDIEIAGGMTVSRIEISPLLQSLFSEWTDTRTVYAHVSLRSKKASLLSFHTYVVYGSADNGLTRFLLSAKKNNILVNFINFPFYVSVFRGSQADSISFNGELYDTQIIGFVDVPIKTSGTLVCHKSADTVAVFDNTFDRTFIELYPSGVDEEYEILESPSTEGVYIRWIDIYGERHYYLFDENDCSIIVETSDYRLKNSNGELGERSFVNKVCTQLKCSAENIDSESLSYVLGVLDSTHVEKYSNGEWLPVSVKDGQTIEHDKVLRDIEFTLEQDIITQRL